MNQTSITPHKSAAKCVKHWRAVCFTCKWGTSHCGFDWNWIAACSEISNCLDFLTNAIWKLATDRLMLISKDFNIYFCFHPLISTCKKESVIAVSNILLVLKSSAFICRSHYWDELIQWMLPCDIKSLNYFDYLSLKVLNVF